MRRSVHLCRRSPIKPNAVCIHPKEIQTDKRLMAFWSLLPMAPAASFAGPERTLMTRAMEWVADSRAHRVVCIVTGIWILNAFDLTLTILAHDLGVLHEENPLALGFLDGGTASIMLFKIGLVLLGSYPLLRFRTTRISELGSLVVMVVYAFLAIRWTACYDLYTYSINSGFFFAEAK